MSWNYRVLKKDGALGVYAVYYDDAENIQGWSEHPFSPVAEDLDELKTTLTSMVESLEKEIVEVGPTPEDRNKSRSGNVVP